MEAHLDPPLAEVDPPGRERTRDYLARLARGARETDSPPLAKREERAGVREVTAAETGRIGPPKE